MRESPARSRLPTAPEGSVANGVPLSGNSDWPVVYQFPRSARIGKPKERASSALSCGFTVV